MSALSVRLPVRLATAQARLRARGHLRDARLIGVRAKPLPVPPIPGFVLYLSTRAGVIRHGAPPDVTAWVDPVTARGATQSSDVLKPHLQSNDADYAGANSVLFASDRLVIPSAPAFGLSGGITIYSVQVGVDRLITKWNGTSGNLEWRLLVSTGPGNPRFIIKAAGAGTYSATYAVNSNDGAAHVFAAWYDDVNDEVGINFDGSASPVTAAAPDHTALTGEDVVIGAEGDGTTPWAGTTAMFVVYPVAHSASQRSVMEQWTAAQFAL